MSRQKLACSNRTKERDHFVPITQQPLSLIKVGDIMVLRSSSRVVDREGLVCHTTFLPHMPKSRIVAHFAGVRRKKTHIKSQCYLGLTNDPNVTTKTLIFYPFSRRSGLALKGHATEIGCLLNFLCVA